MSADNYDIITAYHYAAYRPPLHEKILSLAIPQGLQFKMGLDIGAGTGYSTIALAAYCDQVIGIEPSVEMPTRATPHPCVSYIDGSGESLPFTLDNVDVVTLAGSLFYIDKTTLLSELKRVCQKSSYIIVYDFEIDLSSALSFFNLNPESNISGYDHQANLSGHNELSEIGKLNKKISLSLTHPELAHILLSSTERLRALETVLASNHLQYEIENRLSDHNFSPSVFANIYSSIYRLR